MSERESDPAGQEGHDELVEADALGGSSGGTRRMPRAEKTYRVTERLVGAAFYTVRATSKAEAWRKVRESEVDMDDMRVHHLGRGVIEIAPGLEKPHG